MHSLSHFVNNVREIIVEIFGPVIMLEIIYNYKEEINGINRELNEMLCGI